MGNLSYGSCPLVSVVIPSYNRAQYIAEAIDSVLTQTYPNVEIIVIDDGSTDNTREIVRKYYPTVNYVWQPNSERGASRNNGLRLANGEFISFLDSDDLWMSSKIEDDLRIFKQNPSFGVVYSDIEQIDASGNHVKTVIRDGHQGWVTNQLLLHNFVSIGAHLASTAIVKKTGGFREERELSGSEDWELWVRLSTITKFGHLPKPTAKIRTHEANTMSEPEIMNCSMAYALEVVENSDYLSAVQKKLLVKTRSYMALIDAINHCSKHQNRQTAVFLKKAITYNPAIAFDPRFGYTIYRMLRSAFTHAN